MLKAASAVPAVTTREESSPAQHTVTQTLGFHLLPGALITFVFVLLGPWLQQNHLPPMLAILIPILVVLIPFELGVLYYLGYQRNGRLSLDGIVLYRQPSPVKDYLIFVPVLLFWSVFMFMGLGGLDQAIINALFSWLPGWFQINHFSAADYSQSALTATYVLFILLNGLAGPIVEELYFRGFLLPRIEYMKGWAALVNVLLFSLYHFFSPWQNITRILALIPMVYTVRWKKNIYLSILTHCLLNTGSCLLAIPLFFK